MAVEEYLNSSGLTKLWNKIKSKFADIDNSVYYVVGTHDYPAWAANKVYAVGDLVVSSGTPYTCKTAHTSSSSFDSSKWTQVTTAVWKGTIEGINELKAGIKIAYKIPINGGSSSTYLNINNLGNKYVYKNTGNTTANHLPINTIVFLTYDGTYWKWADFTVGDNYYAASDLYCSTDANTAAKTAVGISLSLSKHNNIAFRIYFTNTNTVQGQLTLNVNNQGAKNLFINGTNSSSSNYTIPTGVYWCYYDGTQWQLWTDKSIWGLKYRGDGSNLTEAFTTASSRANIATGESNATIFGKIAKWFSDLKALAFKDKVSDSDINGTISDTHIASASTWDGKYTKPSTGIPKTDLDSAVQTSLGKADTALQNHQDISGKASISHTHGVKINGSTKSVPASGEAAVDLGTYLPYSEGTDISTTDFNNFTTPGVYTITGSSATNQPPITAEDQRTSLSYGQLTVSKYKSHVYQFWYDYEYRVMATRYYRDSSWSNWKYPYAGNDINLSHQVSGVLPESNGGTGQTSLNSTVTNKLINALPTGSDNAADADYYISQYTKGGTTNTTYYRKPVSRLKWAMFTSPSVNTTSIQASDKHHVLWFTAARTLNLTNFETGSNYFLVLKDPKVSGYSITLKNNIGKTVTVYLGSKSTNVANNSTIAIEASSPNYSGSGCKGSIAMLFRSANTTFYILNSY